MILLLLRSCHQHIRNLLKLCLADLVADLFRAFIDLTADVALL